MNQRLLNCIKLSSALFLLCLVSVSNAQQSSESVTNNNSGNGFAKPKLAQAMCPKKPRPAYPRYALQQGIEAEVVVQFKIESDSKPKEIRVVSNSSINQFAGAAIEAVQKFECEPDVKAYIVEVPLSFSIENILSDPLTLDSFKMAPGIVGFDSDPNRTADLCPAVIRIKLNAPEALNEIDPLSAKLSEGVLNSLKLMEPDYSRISPRRKGGFVFVKLPCKSSNSTNIN